MSTFSIYNVLIENSLKVASLTGSGSNDVLYADEYGNIGITSSFSFTNIQSGTAGYLAFYPVNGATLSSNSGLYKDISGNIIIGGTSTSSTYKLDVYGSAIIRGTFSAPYLDTQYFKQGGNTFSSIGVLGTNDDNNLYLRTNGITRINIKTDNTTEFGGYPYSNISVGGGYMRMFGNSSTGIAGIGNNLYYSTGWSHSNISAFSGNGSALVFSGEYISSIFATGGNSPATTNEPFRLYNNGRIILRTNNSKIGSEASYSWALISNNIASIDIFNSNNVGIGTLGTDAGYKLDVNGSAIIRGTFSLTDLNYFENGTYSLLYDPISGLVSYASASSAQGFVNYGTAGYIPFYNSDGISLSPSDTLYFENQILNIGTTASIANLKVLSLTGSGSNDVLYADEYGNIGVTSSFSFTNVNSGTAGYLAYYPVNGSTLSAASILYWDNTNGRLGIGTASPTYSLDVLGTARTRTLLIDGFPSQLGIGEGWGIRIARNKYTELTGITNSLTQNARGFQENSLLTLDSGAAYASFDALTLVYSERTMNTDHIVNFQARSVWEGGSFSSTLNDYYGFASFPSVKNGVITNVYDFISGGLFQTGLSTSVVNYYILYGEDIAKNASNIKVTNTWGLYLKGNSVSNYIQGDLILGTNSKSGYKLDVRGTASVNALRISSLTGSGSNDVLYADEFGNIGVTSSFSFTNVNSGTAGYLAYYPTNGATLSSAGILYWDQANARLGVGTASPQYTLDVTGDARFRNQMLLSSGTNFSILGNSIFKFRDLANTTDIFSINANESTGETRITVNWFSIRPSSNLGITSPVIIGDNAYGGPSFGPTSSAILHLKSTTKGFLQPVLTLAQRDAISSPSEGLSIYNSDYNTPDYYNGINWQSVILPNSSGNVLIGTFSDNSYKLNVNGSAYIGGTFSAPYLDQVYIKQGGNSFSATMSIGTIDSHSFIIKTGNSNKLMLLGGVGSSILHLNPNGLFNGQLYINSQTGYGSSLIFQNNSSDQWALNGSATSFSIRRASQNRFEIFNSNNIGIGTNGTDAGYKLDVLGSLRTETIVISSLTGSGSNDLLYVNENGLVGLTSSSGSANINSGTAGYLAYYPENGATISSAGILFWDQSNGRLGIATASPAYTLSVNGTSYFSNTAIFSGNVNNTTGDYQFRTISFLYSTSGNWNFKLYNSSNVNKVYLNTNGTSFIDNNLAVGTNSNNNYQFFVQGTASVTNLNISSLTGSGSNDILYSDEFGNIGLTSSFSFTNVQSGTAGYLAYYPVDGATLSSNDVLYKSSSNNILIGSTTDDSYKLDVNGSAIVRGTFSVNGQVNINYNLATGSIADIKDSSNNSLVRIDSNGGIYLQSSSANNLSVGSYSMFETNINLGNSIFIDYYVNSTLDYMRSGNITSVWNSSNIEYTETSTNDIGGDTSGIEFIPYIIGNTVSVKAIINSGTWSIKFGVRVV